MASILFVPVCSECGNLITDEVDFIEHNATNKAGNVLMKYQHIQPTECRKCGAEFEVIAMPKFPVRVKNFIDWWDNNGNS